MQRLTAASRIRWMRETLCFGFQVDVMECWSRLMAKPRLDGTHCILYVHAVSSQGESHVAICCTVLAW